MVRMPDSVAVVNTSVAAECGNCGVEERRLLHHVGQRGTFRRLCTGCVLRLHAQSFCPTCFQVYPPAPPNDAVLTCAKCYSISHHRCVVSEGKNPPPKPYICPLCANPNAPIFKLKITKEITFDTVENWRSMDADAARKLLAAGKIASLSMNKAAAAARVEAERRAKEAAFTRKRAREALEHLANLVKKDKLRKKKSPGAIVVYSEQNVNPETNENVHFGNGNAEQVPNGTISCVGLENDGSNLLLEAWNAGVGNVDDKIDDLAAAVGELGGESDDEVDEGGEGLMINEMEDVGGGVAEMNDDFMVSNDVENGSHLEEEEPK